jgi:hypothetical protein
MALVYQTNELTWQDDSDQWKLAMQVTPSQEGVSNHPFVVERFITEEDLLDNDGNVKSVEAVTSELDTSGKYLFRRVATVSDLQSLPTVNNLAAELVEKQTGRMESTLTDSGANGPTVEGVQYSFEAFDYPNNLTASSHYDHIPVVGYYKFRVSSLAALYSTYDLAAAIQEANDTYLRVYAGDFLEDPSKEFLPLSVGIAGVYPSRTFTPGSLQASDLVAGDSIYLNVSGGSSDYTASIDKEGLLETLSATRRYRVVNNTNEDVTITISDNNTGESKQVALTIVRKGD